MATRAAKVNRTEKSASAVSGGHVADGAPADARDKQLLTVDCWTTCKPTVEATLTDELLRGMCTAAAGDDDDAFLKAANDVVNAILDAVVKEGFISSADNKALYGALNARFGQWGTTFAKMAPSSPPEDPAKEEEKKGMQAARAAVLGAVEGALKKAVLAWGQGGWPVERMIAKALESGQGSDLHLHEFAGIVPVLLLGEEPSHSLIDRHVQAVYRPLFEPRGKSMMVVMGTSGSGKTCAMVLGFEKSSPKKRHEVVL